MTSIEEYLSDIDNPKHRRRTEEILGWVTDKFPDLELQIKWNQPMFIDYGTFIIAFSVSKHHLSVAPEATGMTQFANEIAESGYSATKGIFRIKWDQSVNYKLLKKMIEFNIEDKADCSTFWRK